MVIINNFNDFQQHALDAVTHWRASDARQLLLQIDPAKFESLKTVDSDLYSRYKKLQVLLQITAIPVLTNEEVLEIVRVNLLQGFIGEMDITERLELKLLVFPELIRDSFRERILKVMLANEQRLGNRFVRDWLMDYNKTIGAKKHDNVERTEYMMKNKEAQNLNEADRAVLRKVLSLYDSMKVEMAKNEVSNSPSPVSSKNVNV